MMYQLYSMTDQDAKHQNLLLYFLALFLSVCLYIPLMFSFSMRSVSYQRKAGDMFFPELLLFSVTRYNLYFT
jgi:hypothetical protein